MIQVSINPLLVPIRDPIASTSVHFPHDGIVHAKSKLCILVAYSALPRCAAGTSPGPGIAFSGIAGLGQRSPGVGDGIGV